MFQDSSVFCVRAAWWEDRCRGRAEARRLWGRQFPVDEPRPSGALSLFFYLKDFTCGLAFLFEASQVYLVNITPYFLLSTRFLPWFSTFQEIIGSSTCQLTFRLPLDYYYFSLINLLQGILLISVMLRHAWMHYLQGRMRIQNLSSLIACLK